MMKEDFTTVLASGNYVAASDLARSAVRRPDVVAELKILMENAYISGDAGVRHLITHGLLEHLLEAPEVSRIFENWRRDERLSGAWQSASAWARWVRQKTRVLKNVADLCAEQLNARGLPAVVDDPEMGVDSVTVRWPTPKGSECALVIDCEEGDLVTLQTDSAARAFAASYAADPHNWREDEYADWQLWVTVRTPNSAKA